MTRTGTYTSDLSQLEYKLAHQFDPLQRLLLIDRLAAYYVFTNIKRSKELLNEQIELLKVVQNADFELNYHLYSGIVENQLYHYEASEYHFEQAIEIIEERGDVKQQAEAYIDYVGTCINLGNMDLAEDFLEKSAKLLKNFPDEVLEARLTCREGFMNLHYANYSQAIELLLKADKSITAQGNNTDLKDYYFLTLIHSGLGWIYEKNDDLEKSVDAYTKVAEMCEEKGMRTRLSWHYLNVGNGYMALNELDKAELFFEKAIYIEDDVSQAARASAYANLGYCNLEKKEYEKALDLFDGAEHLFPKGNDSVYYNFSVIDAWRGRLYSEIGKPEKSKIHLESAFQYANLVKDYKQLSSVSKDIANHYADLEEFKEAYEYLILHDKFKEKYTEQINKRKQMEFEYMYEAEKKRQETELLQLQATKLQLKALRAQMNPHFMYNALNAIQNYITSNKVTFAAKYLAKFAKLMRQSLDYSDLEIISLEKEIEFLEDYLFINEKLRFQDQLRYEIEVDDEIEEDILGVPTMIVQPYVENAIEHGLRTIKDGLISLKFEWIDEEMILCIVEDNGIGREKARQLQMEDAQFKNYKSKGTNITEKRLQILHNSKNEGLFVKTIDLKDPKTGAALGTRVEIIIPIVEIQMK